MRLKLDKREFEVPQDELGRLIREEYDKTMREWEKRGLIPLDEGLFGVLDGYFGSSGLGRQVPRCMACGSFYDYTGECRYRSKIKVIDSGKEKTLCQKDDNPLVNLIEDGKLNNYEVKTKKAGGKSESN